MRISSWTKLLTMRIKCIMAWWKLSCVTITLQYLRVISPLDFNELEFPWFYQTPDLHPPKTWTYLPNIPFNSQRNHVESSNQSANVTQPPIEPHLNRSIYSQSDRILLWLQAEVWEKPKSVWNFLMARNFIHSTVINFWRHFLFPSKCRHVVRNKLSLFRSFSLLRLMSLSIYDLTRYECEWGPARVMMTTQIKTFHHSVSLGMEMGRNRSLMASWTHDLSQLTMTHVIDASHVDHGMTVRQQ